MTSLEAIVKSQNDNEALYLQIPLEEMQKLYERQISGVDSIKNNVRAVLSAASLIVSLVSAMQIVSARISPDWLAFYQAAVVFAVFLYIALIIMCISALWPVNVIGPMKADWDELTTSYKNKTYLDAIRLQLSSVLNAIDENAPILNRLKYLQISVQILLAILVTLILLMALIPRI